jgi:ureidoacrylate peracid hydrolase
MATFGMHLDLLHRSTARYAGRGSGVSLESAIPRPNLREAPPSQRQALYLPACRITYQLSMMAREHLSVVLGESMTELKFEPGITGLILIDPYNDFISKGGKLWNRIKSVAEANDCIPHMLELLTAARKTGVRVFYAMHHRYRPGDYESWRCIAPIQKAAWSRKTFEYGTWGGDFRAEFAPQPGDTVAQEHWCSSGFANTDLDLQLKRHGIHRLIVAGLIAHTCVESTVRFATELGYDVTPVRDATADYSEEFMHAALVTNLPNYASAIVTTQEVIDALSGEHPVAQSSSAAGGTDA